MTKSANKKSGFTIVELVIVIAVIAILAAVLIPKFSQIIGRANESAQIQEARNALTSAAASYGGRLPGKAADDKYCTFIIVSADTNERNVFAYDDGSFNAAVSSDITESVTAGDVDSVLLGTQELLDSAAGTFDENVLNGLAELFGTSAASVEQSGTGYLLSSGSVRLNVYVIADLADNTVILTRTGNTVPSSSGTSTPSTYSITIEGSDFRIWSCNSSISEPDEVPAGTQNYVFHIKTANQEPFPQSFANPSYEQFIKIYKSDNSLFDNYTTNPNQTILGITYIEVTVGLVDCDLRIVINDNPQQGGGNEDPITPPQDSSEEVSQESSQETSSETSEEESQATSVEYITINLNGVIMEYSANDENDDLLDKIPKGPYTVKLYFIPADPSKIDYTITMNNIDITDMAIFEIDTSNPFSQNCTLITLILNEVTGDIDIS